MRSIKSAALVVSLALLAACQPEAPEALAPWSEFTPVTGESRAGYLLDESGSPYEVHYVVAEGRAIVGGDMDFGPADSIPQSPEEALRQASGLVDAFSNYRPGTSARWPDNGTNITIPYTIEANSSGVTFTTTQRNNIQTAINQIHAASRVRFVARTTQADYVRIIPGSDICTVGRVGGAQNCQPSGNIWQVAMHELGHAMGLHHEHQRSDRNTHIIVYTSRTYAPGEYAILTSTQATASGAYDFNSAMHYGPTQFASGTAHVMEPNRTTYPNARLWTSSSSCTDSTILIKPMGCRTGLSAGDVAGINAMYGSAAVNNARFIGYQNLPTTMRVGQYYTVTAIFENNGTTNWDPALGYKLGSQSPQDNSTWSFNRAALPGIIYPGQWGYISFTVRAPSSAGTYNFQWRMLRENVAWFGEYSTNQPISVTW